jgi:hypothetical protein
MDITTLLALIGEIVALIGVITPVIMRVNKISNGTKCQLRSEMLRTYYRNKDAESIRQYELQNFIMLYESYKALNGNSFVDKIYEEVMSWEVIS